MPAASICRVVATLLTLATILACKGGPPEEHSNGPAQSAPSNSVGSTERTVGSESLPHAFRSALAQSRDLNDSIRTILAAYTAKQLSVEQATQFMADALQSQNGFAVNMEMTPEVRQLMKSVRHEVQRRASQRR
jgi:hypothetical protein